MLFVDIETDDLDAKKVHVICLASKTGEVEAYHGDRLDEAVSIISEADWVCGHNIIGFDLPVLKKLLGLKYKGNVFDTYVTSSLMFPDLEKGHSLKEWGIRLGLEKAEFSEFSELSQEMIDYCKQDVEVLRKLYFHLLPRIKSEGWSKSLKTEHEIAKIMRQQEEDGWCFDTINAKALAEAVEARLSELEGRVAGVLPKRNLRDSEKKSVTPPLKQFKKDGTPSELCKSFFDRVELEGAEWYGWKYGVKYKLPMHEPLLAEVQCEIKDSAEIKQWLMDEYGWKPTLWNLKKKKDQYGKSRTVKEEGKPVKASPKFHDKGVMCENLEKLGERSSFVRPLIEWLVLRHRLGLINSLLSNVREDGRIPSVVNPQATPTGRMSHSVVANIPKNEEKILLGKEIRSLFIPRRGYVMTGVDASSIDMRAFAHYMGDEEFINELVSGDIHTILWEVCEDLIPSRSVSKSVEYAAIYGASPPRLGETAGHPPKKAKAVGEEIMRRWMKRFPSWEELTEKVERASSRGHLVGLDGRHIPIRSKHSALNYLCQGAASVLVKRAIVTMHEIWNDTLETPVQLGVFHDEVQIESSEEESFDAGNAFIIGLKRAEKEFGLKCPLAGEVKHNKRNWAETH